MVLGELHDTRFERDFCKSGPPSHTHLLKLKIWFKYGDRHLKLDDLVFLNAVIVLDFYLKIGFDLAWIRFCYVLVYGCYVGNLWSLIQC